MTSYLCFENLCKNFFIDNIPSHNLIISQRFLLVIVTEKSWRFQWTCLVHVKNSLHLTFIFHNVFIVEFRPMSQMQKDRIFSWRTTLDKEPFRIIKDLLEKNHFFFGQFSVWDSAHDFRNKSHSAVIPSGLNHTFMTFLCLFNSKFISGCKYYECQSKECYISSSN